MINFLRRLIYNFSTIAPALALAMMIIVFVIIGLTR